MQSRQSERKQQKKKAKQAWHENVCCSHMVRFSMLA